MNSIVDVIIVYERSCSGLWQQPWNSFIYLHLFLLEIFWWTANLEVKL